MKYQRAVYPDSEDPETLTWAATYTSDYTKGHAPSVALTFENAYPLFYDVAVEVHQGGQDGGAALWSHLAVTDTSIPPTLTWTNGDQYDNGYNPKVAIDPSQSYNYYANFSTVVEVHQAGPNTSDLWYHVGTLKAANYTGQVALTWGPSYQFDYGYVPSVGVCGGVAVEVHEGDSGSLWYSIGMVNGDQVSWSGSVQYDSGRNPSVSMCGAPGYLVEVHQGGAPSTGKSTSLWYHVSEYTSSAVTWEPAVQYSTGCYPTATSTQANLIVSDPLVVETHAGACGVAAPLYYDLGSVTPTGSPNSATTP